MSKRLIAPAIGALLVALVATGCGGGDDEQTTGSISKAEFIRKADVICAKGDRQVERKFAAFLKKEGIKVNPSEQTEAEIADLSTEIVETILLPSTRRDIEEIRALGAPSGDEDEIDEIIEALEEAIERSEEDPQTALSANTEIFRRPKGLSEEYGLEVCGY